MLNLIMKMTIENGAMKQPLPSQQIVICQVADSQSPEAVVYIMEKDAQDLWRLSLQRCKSLIGRHGSVWAEGIHATPKGCIKKKEGDLRSPSGIFPITKAFGKEHILKELSVGLESFAVHEHLRYVDDPNSEYYNQCVDMREHAVISWNSAESMLRDDALYDLGLVIGYNERPCIPGAGSCIFIHAWKGRNEGSAGCVTLDFHDLTRVVTALKPKLNPLLILATREIMHELSMQYDLPKECLIFDACNTC